MKKDCPYDAFKIYNDIYKAYNPILGNAMAFRGTRKEYINELLSDEKYPYGRCVFACDNDVVDHQIVSMEMENDVTISFSMDAFTLGDQRETHMRLTHGEIDGDERILRVRRFRGGEEQVYDFSGILGKPFHAGADLNLVEDFVDTISRREHRFRTSIGKSVESHRICFEAERSRLSGQTVILDQTR